VSIRAITPSTVILSTLLVLGLFLNLNDRAAKWFQSLFQGKGRVLLAVVDYRPPHRIRQVLKFKTPEGFTVEVLGAIGPSGQRDLLGTVLLTDREDTYFNVSGRPTNLAILDRDSDGEPEILVPTLDPSGRPKLNVIRWNKDTAQFEVTEALSAE
jgi:hypothetical protein